MVLQVQCLLLLLVVGQVKQVLLVAVIPVHHVDLLHVEVSQVVSHQNCLLLVDQVLVVEVTS